MPKYGDLDDTTEYGREYGIHPGAEAAKAMRPKVTRRSSLPLESKTEQSTNFVKWPLPKFHRPAPVAVHRVRSEPMLLQTTAGDAYQGKKALPAESKKPAETYFHSDQPLQKETTHYLDFGEKPFNNTRAHRPQDRYQPPKLPFNASSTAQDTYKQHVGVRRPKSFKPDVQEYRQTAPLDDNTTFTDSYQAWRAHPPVPRPPEKHVPPNGDLATATTHKQAYTNPGLQEPERSCRPPTRVRTQSEPMLESTTHADAFRHWRVKPARPIRNDFEWHAPPRDFVGKTECQAEYQGKQSKPLPSFKPEETAQAPMNFAGITRYKEDYYRKPLPHCPAAGLQQLSLTGGKTKNNLAFSHATTSGHQIFVPTAVNKRPDNRISIP